ncbi:class I SAM-dependent DNA methyltransferase [Thalassorhabdomicrobium marinisediminis]|uniref:class I SAM-dependent DNA methyltransferase n=1 Tax=Thalassorhabdomicrobium marinisediminis TaxID=2170577 RepID=UPI0024938D14|nr:methyltransferase domain-containing protein [Thalassorhabdomicrobium marinisediminis]
MTTDKETLAVYDARAEDYESRFAGDAPSALLQRFINAVPDGGRVLDLGCGPGSAAAHMAAADLRVDATDASPEMVRLAQAKPGVTARQATFDELDATALYDGIWANFSLLHATRADLPRHLDRIAKALKDAGVFHIGMKTGDGEGRDTLGRRYTYVRAKELRQMLEAAGLDIIAQDTGHEVGLSGSDDWWIVLMAQKHHG